MATFKEISRIQIEDILTTTVEITYSKNEFNPVRLEDITISVDINHYKPQTEQEILLGINNRIITEKKKL